MPKTQLSSINSPKDLKNLTYPELIELSHDIRQRIIQVMSVNGGHLASNLGSLEISLALHYAFNSPHDKFIFDVSHQSYTHKLLTGRNNQFNTIRKFKGLSGFTHPKESEHDHFFAGHAGTALSLGLGLLKQQKLTNDDNYIIPIIGDATLTCGTALEAMNNIQRDMKRLIVILNDNQMSISKNVGAITHILSRFVNHPTTHKVINEIDHLVSKLPSVGESLSYQGRKFSESLRNIVSPASFFEHYGLSYIGPIDGHDLGKIIDTLEAVKNSDHPVIIHFHTKKGNGMECAVQNPTTYHGAKPFEPSTGKFLPASPQLTFPKIFGKKMVELAEKDSKVVAVTPAMSAGSCLDKFRDNYPERFFDVGMAESHSMTFSGALAKTRQLKVVLAIYSTFLQRALDNLYHDVCLQEIPLVLGVDRGGLAGGDGATHNGIYDISFMNAMPNMIIAQPRNGQLLEELLESAFDYEQPTAVRYPNIPTTLADLPKTYRPKGKGEILSQGENICIIGLGHKALTALEVKDLLLEQGINATVVDPIFVKPLDEDLFHELMTNHTHFISIEEHSACSGLGSILSTFFTQKTQRSPHHLILGIGEEYIEHGSHTQLTDLVSLSAPQIAKKAILWLNQTQAPFLTMGSAVL